MYRQENPPLKVSVSFWRPEKLSVIAQSLKTTHELSFSIITEASQSTAELIIAAGKGLRVTKRPEGVQAKGKGIMATFWIDPQAKDTRTASSTDDGTVISELETDLATPVKTDIEI